MNPPSALPLKPHLEFFAIRPDHHDTRWREVAVTRGRVQEIILADNLDATSLSGSRTRLARWHSGALIDKPVIHDFHEEVFIFEGDLVVGCDVLGLGGESFGALSFACRPPGVLHGPFMTKTGCMMLEFQYYGVR